MSVFSYIFFGLVFTVVAIPALHLLAGVARMPILSFIARCIASYVALIICASYGVVASAVLRLVGYGGLGQWTVARSFKWTMWFLTGVWFEIEDKEGALNTRPAVFVGNHQTELDVLMLGAMFPRYCSVTAKSSLKYVPVLGWFMYLSKTVFINRASRSAALAAFASAAETMHSHQQSVFIFPEGTRSYSSKPELLPFKKGAFHLAVQAQVPVVPVVVANYSNVLDIKRKIFNSGIIPVSVLKPVETKGLTKDDVGSLLKGIEDMMAKEYLRISERAQREGIADLQKGAQGSRTGKATGIDLGLAS